MSKKEALNYMVTVTIKMIPSDSYEEVCEKLENKMNDMGLTSDWGIGEEDPDGEFS